MDDEHDVVTEIELVEQCIEPGAVLDEPVRVGADVVELVRPALPDQIGRDAASEPGDVRDDVCLLYTSDAADDLA